MSLAPTSSATSFRSHSLFQPRSFEPLRLYSHDQPVRVSFLSETRPHNSHIHLLLLRFQTRLSLFSLSSSLFPIYTHLRLYNCPLPPNSSYTLIAREATYQHSFNFLFNFLLIRILSPSLALTVPSPELLPLTLQSWKSAFPSTLYVMPPKRPNFSLQPSSYTLRSCRVWTLAHCKFTSFIYDGIYLGK